MAPVSGARQASPAHRFWIAAASGVVLALAGLVHAHGGDHEPATDASQAPAPGWGALGFDAPDAGTYALPSLGAAGDSEVLRSDGSATTLHRVFGRELVLFSFIYASCSDLNGCPLASAVLQRVQRRLRSEDELEGEVRLVSLSFDPSRDTPDVMRRYGESFAREGPDWQFLTTASQQVLAPILEQYGQAIRKEYAADGTYLGSISHLLRVFLIDREHEIRNIYSVSFLHPDLLLSDIKTLLMAEEERTLLLADARSEDQGEIPGLRGPGDYRGGYERADYRTRSVGLTARRGEAADLTARLHEPPLGLPPLPTPPDNPPTAAKIALGRKLFFDRRLSANGTFSCAMCHIPEQGFTSNEQATAVGIEGRTVRRNAPTIYNVAYVERLFHDGRETRLEHQIWSPLLARNEMGNPSIGAVVEKIRGLPEYTDLFEEAFPDRRVAMETIGMALASYQRALLSGGSPFDRWFFAGAKDAISESAKRGFSMFVGKAACGVCHQVSRDSALFSDGAFHNTGIGYAASMLGEPERLRVLVSPGRYLEIDRGLIAPISEPRPNDLGRYEISQDPNDRWKYRTPTLRNVALTAPYMHDGSLATLREVVEFYDRGGLPNELLDPLMRPLHLDPAEIDDLVSFLRSLTGDDVEMLVRDAFAAPVGDVRAEEP